MSDTETIHDALRRWGSYRSREYRASFARVSSRVYSAPEYSTFMKTCPRCLGAKNIKVFAIAGPDLRTAPCPDCRGRGVFRVRYPLIDPAIIPGRSVMRVDRGPPALFLTIDGAVESFDLRRRVVVLTRYAYEPHAKSTARLVVVNRLLCENGSKRIAGQRFADILVDVKKRLSAITGLPFRLENALDSVKQ